MTKMAAMLTALVMMLALAAPALAQTAVDDSVARDNSTTTVYRAVAQNVVGDIETGDATQYGDATATATNDSTAHASIDADLDTSVSLENDVDHLFWHYYDGWYYWW